MTIAAPLGVKAHLTSGIDSRRSNSAATDRNLSQIVENPLRDDRSFPRFSDEATKWQSNHRIELVQLLTRRDSTMPKRLLGCIMIGIFLWDAEAPIVSIRDI